MAGKDFLQCGLSFSAAEEVEFAIGLLIFGFKILGIVNDEVTPSKVEGFLHSRRVASNGLLFRVELDVSKTPRSPITMSVYWERKKKLNKRKQCEKNYTRSLTALTSPYCAKSSSISSFVALHGKFPTNKM